MHDNPQVLTEPVFAFPGHHVVAFSGRDAAAFAQAQFMNDVNALGVGQWQWNGWLNPKGRVLALFALIKLEAETLWLLLPDADPSELVAALQRFVFRSKVSIAAREDLHVAGAFATPLRARAAQWDGAQDAAIELDMGGDGGPRMLRIGMVAATQDPIAEDSWAMADLSHGLPRLSAAQSGMWTPQQLSLEQLRAFSIKKGCYPGQEIVARTHFLGKAKRGLVLLEADAPLAAGDQVHDGATALGSVICANGMAERYCALAVLPKEREPMPLTVAGRPVRELPIGYGLAR